MTAIANRYDFVYLFDVSNGNPNGDPDAGNLPRMDPETSQGLVSDVCLKRKVRNYVDMDGGKIFIREREPLNPKIAEAAEVNDLPTFRKSDGKWESKEAKNRSQEDIRLLQEWLCAQYFDIRAFGAVMSTGPNAGQVRGPVQLTFARSVERIMPAVHTITRVADVDKEEGEMGRKHTVPYGLYRAHGYINAKLGEKTGFSNDDLDLLWRALCEMFEHDCSAARGEMAARSGIAFKHSCALGNARAHELFERVKVWRVDPATRHRAEDEIEMLPIGHPSTHNWPPARDFSDYRVTVDEQDLPEGIEIIRFC